MVLLFKEDGVLREGFVEVLVVLLLLSVLEFSKYNAVEACNIV